MKAEIQIADVADAALLYHRDTAQLVTRDISFLSLAVFAIKSERKLPSTTFQPLSASLAHRDVSAGKAGTALSLLGSPGLPHPLSLRGLQVRVADSVVDQTVVDQDVGLVLALPTIFTVRPVEPPCLPCCTSWLSRPACQASAWPSVSPSCN